MKFSQFSFRKTVVKTVKEFFEPLSNSKSRYWVLIITAVITAILYVSLAGVIVQNCMGASVLGVELAKESGREFARAKKPHEDMVSRYVDHMQKKRYLSLLADLLYPEYSAKRHLQPILSTLEKPVRDNDQAREVIHNAGEQIREFCARADQFPGTEVIRFMPRKVPALLLRDLNGALAKTEQLVTEFENHPTLNNAKAACFSDREALLLLSLPRLLYAYRNQEDIQRLQSAVDRARKCMLSLADRIEGDDPDDAALLRTYAHSEQRRIDILDAMSHDDMYAVRVLLRDTIEKAYREDDQKRGD